MTQQSPITRGRPASLHERDRTYAPVRVDVTLWLDGTDVVNVHVHEDAHGEGPMIALADLSLAQRKEITRRLNIFAGDCFKKAWG